MVHLKYIDNPFDEDMMNSISCFSEERSFYDCVNRRFLNDQVFQHLEHSFYTYFLTGDSGEWIGYVLLSNENRVNGYYHFACEKMLDLLNNFRNKFGNLDSERELYRLERLINENSDSPIISAFLDEAVFSLKKMIIQKSIDSFISTIDGKKNSEDLEKINKLVNENYYSNDQKIILEQVYDLLSKLDNENFDLFNDMFLDYEKQLQDYLLQFPEYFYLDVVIALPKKEEINIKRENSNSDLNVNLLVELKYYGFIREAFTKVEEEIQQNFRSIPILLREENKDVFLVNSECLSDDKKVVKQLQGIM